MPPFGGHNAAVAANIAVFPQYAGDLPGAFYPIDRDSLLLGLHAVDRLITGIGIPLEDGRPVYDRPPSRQQIPSVAGRTATTAPPL